MTRFSKCAIVLPIIIVVLIVMLHFGIAIYERNAYEVYALNALARASDLEELNEAVGRFGIVLTYPDGWLAIAYNDSHHIPWSLAVAMDSKRRIYRSTEHFCGRFATYKNFRERVSGWEPYHDLDCLAECRTVDEAGLYLVKEMDFSGPR